MNESIFSSAALNKVCKNDVTDREQKLKTLLVQSHISVSFVYRVVVTKFVVWLTQE